MVAEKAQVGAATSSSSSNVDIATVTAAPASTDERLRLLRPRTASIVACGYRRMDRMYVTGDDDG